MILRIRDSDGNIQEILALKGDNGKSAYQYAREGGYSGTEADFSAQLAFLMRYSAYGYLGNDNNFYILGDIPDGSNISYIDSEGATFDIGQLVLDDNSYYSVTSNLTNCTNSNSATKVAGGTSYLATLTPNSGYEITSIKVTMNLSDITNVAVSGNIISIPNVMGNLVITAVAER